MKEARPLLPVTALTVGLSWVPALATLFKVRIVALLLLAATAGAFLGAGGWPGAGPLSVLMVMGALAAGGSSLLNEYLERDLDARMRRTRHRPLVTGAVPRSRWLATAGVAMVAGPVALTVPFNPPLAVSIAVGAFIYLVVYTLWLKPRTSLNIVIGGGAGSCAVVSGGAAVGAWADPGVLGLALVVFLWTPIHFWSLALACREDYASAGVPMLPVRTTPRRTALWGLAHGLPCAATALALSLHPALGPIYLALVLAGTMALFRRALVLVFDPARPQAWRLFHTSNIYLALVLVAVLLDAPLPLGWPWV